MSPRPWLFLSAAIASEVTGVTVMKIASDSGSLASLLLMYTMIGLSFYFFALAVKRLPLALAYATWETLGLLCITVIGFLHFGETLSLQKMIGMAVVICGVVLINRGAAKSDSDPSSAHAPGKA